MSGTTLRFATLEEWEAWQRASASPLRRLRARWARPEGLVLARSQPGDAAVVVAIDALTSSSRAAVVEPALRLLPSAPVAVLLPAGLVPALPAALRRVVEPATEAPGGIRAILSTSHCLHAGRHALGWARGAGVPYLVVQHGAVTPSYPPLPPDVTLLAWSAADGALWAGGGQPVEVVGSQLLWEAAAGAAERPAAAAGVVFLGQLHGSELERSVTIRTVEHIARSVPLVYRPHPSERDRRSRAQHRRWRRQGLRIDASGRPLTALDAEVVGIFSSGLLEAAAAGRPAWGACVPPIPWVTDFWARYDIPVWTGPGRPAPPAGPGPRAGTEPAQAIADLHNPHTEPVS